MASSATTASLKTIVDIHHQIKSLTGKSITDAHRERVESLLSRLTKLGQVLPPKLQTRVSQWKKGDGSVADAPPSVAKVAAAASARACFATSSRSADTGGAISTRELAAPPLPRAGTTIATTTDPSGNYKVYTDALPTDSFSPSFTSPFITQEDIANFLAGFAYAMSSSHEQTLDSLPKLSDRFGLDIRNSFILHLNDIIVNLIIKIKKKSRENPVNLANIYLAFLSQLGTLDKIEKNKKSSEFFAFLILMHRKIEEPINPRLLFGCILSLGGEIDTIFIPEKKPSLDDGDPVPCKVAKTPLRSDSGIDEEYLKEAFNKGILSGRYLLESTTNMYTSAFSLIDFWLAQLIIINKACPLFTNEISKRAVLAKLRDDRVLAIAPREHRAYALIKLQSYTNSIINAEKDLLDFPKRYFDLVSFFTPAITRIQEKLEAIDAAVGDPNKQRFIIFSLIKEDFEEVLYSQNQFLTYHKEIISAIEKSVKTARLMAYTLLFQDDPDRDIDSIWKKGIRESIEEYMKTHPDPDLTRLDDLKKDVIVEYLEISEKRKTVLNAFRIMFNQLKKTNEIANEKYLPDFIKIRQLYEKGMIDVGGDDRSPPVFHIPKVPTGAVAAESSSNPDYMLTEKSSPTPLKASEHPSRRDLPRPNFYSKLLEIYPLEAFNDLRAAQAYTSALGYVESLYNLMIRQNRGTIEGHTLGHLQMDIGLAAFYALEQLLTAILLEKETKTPEGGAGTGRERELSVFKTLRHSLTNRLIKARLPASSEVHAVLKETEGMELAIRDLERRYHIPPLLKNTSALLSQTEKTRKTLPDEEAKNLAFGNRVMQAFIELLLIVSPNRFASSIDLVPYLMNIQKVPELRGTEHSRLSDPLPADPKKATPPDLVLSAVDDLKETMNSALNNSKDYLEGQVRRIMIEHNLNRYRYLVSCISLPSNLPLFPFYVNQARFTLRTIIEEFLCAAYESKIGPIDQKELSHRLGKLAILFLDPSTLFDREREFLGNTPDARNEARYGHKAKAHLLPMASSEVMASALEEAELGSGGAEEGFEMALRPRYRRMLENLHKEFQIVESLSSKIAVQCFPDLAEKE